MGGDGAAAAATSSAPTAITAILAWTLYLKPRGKNKNTELGRPNPTRGR